MVYVTVNVCNAGTQYFNFSFQIQSKPKKLNMDAFKMDVNAYVILEDYISAIRCSLDISNSKLIHSKLM